MRPCFSASATICARDRTWGIGTTNATSAGAAGVRPGPGSPVNLARTRNGGFEGAKVRVGMAIARCPQISCAGVGWWSTSTNTSTLRRELPRARGRGRQRSGWAVLGSLPACLLDRLPHPARRERERGDADAEVAEGITHGVGDRAAQSRVAALTEAAEPERVRRGRHLLVEADDGWHVVGPGQRVVHQGAGQELALAVVVEALEQRVADAEGDTADELAVDQGRIHGPADVGSDRDLAQGDAAGLRIDVGDDADGAAGVGQLGDGE